MDERIRRLAATMRVLAAHHPSGDEWGAFAYSIADAAQAYADGEAVEDVIARLESATLRVGISS